MLTRSRPHSLPLSLPAALLLASAFACSESVSPDVPDLAPIEPEDGAPVEPQAATPEDEPEAVVVEPEPLVVDVVADQAIEPIHVQTPYPFVLVHGFTGFSDLGPLDYFFGVESLYEDLGSEVFAPSQPPFSSSIGRARVLADHVNQVLAFTGADKVHLICHSQGGLDCRELVAHVEGMEAKVSTIITVATPHHGTPLADLALIAPDGVLNPAGRFLGWLLGALDGDPPDDSAWNNDTEELVDDWDPRLSDSVLQMSSEGAAAFNEATPDTSVPIYSVAAFSNLVPANSLCDGGLLWDRPNRVDSMDPLLLATVPHLSDYSILNPRLNDGVVPTDSMIWGQFLGCVPADHLDEVGQIADFTRGLISGFSHKEMYEELHDFARSVERQQLIDAGVLDVEGEAAGE